MAPPVVERCFAEFCNIPSTDASATTAHEQQLVSAIIYVRGGVGVPIVCVYICKHVCTYVGVYACSMHLECLHSLQSAHVSVVSLKYRGLTNSRPRPPLRQVINHAKIFKGWPPRDAHFLNLKVVQLWYKSSGTRTDYWSFVNTKKMMGNSGKQLHINREILV